MTSPKPLNRPNIIVNHTNWDWYNSQPQHIVNIIARQRYYFAHASVGANILEGCNALNANDWSKYCLTLKTTNSSVPESTIGGTIYEYPHGNPGWLKKIRSFETEVKRGWHDPIIDVAMYKLCYIDQKTDWRAYLDSMVNLEAQYPNTRFVYWTIPLTTSGDTNGILRVKFNANLRDWISTQNNKILMDIADIEAWSPAGEHQTFNYKGVSYDHLYSGYTTDGGHLNSTGSERAATALYSIFGLVVHNTLGLGSLDGVE